MMANGRASRIIVGHVNNHIAPSWMYKEASVGKEGRAGAEDGGRMVSRLSTGVNAWDTTCRERLLLNTRLNKTLEHVMEQDGRALGRESDELACITHNIQPSSSIVKNGWRA